jgi:hypothetical protein
MITVQDRTKFTGVWKNFKKGRQVLRLRGQTDHSTWDNNKKVIVDGNLSEI